MPSLIIYYPDKRQLVTQIAKCGVNALLVQPKKKSYNIVLTGGTSGSVLAEYLVKYLNKRKNIHLLRKSELHFWLSDERLVDKNSDARNDKRILDSLKLLSNKYQYVFHTMLPAENCKITDAKNSYSRDLEMNLAGDILDLVILSLSDDGHLASIFNISSAYDISATRVEITQNPSSDSPVRLSLSLSQLAQSKVLLILAHIDEPHIRKRRFLLDASSVVSKLIDLAAIQNSKSSILIYTNEEENL